MKTPLALLLIVLSTLPAYAEPRTQPTLDPRALLHALEEAFTTVADRVTPAVVNVSTVPRKQSAEETPERFREFFGEEFYERFFRRRPREDTRASGSGVTVDPRGYILTNNHVIENAQDITVRLSDGRKFTAKLVGRDPKTDLAVLKVEAPSPLPAAELGDSDHLRVGQWAIAIGNPFGLDRTVTVGIISATARNRVGVRSEEHTSELQSLAYLVCRLLLEKKKNTRHRRASVLPSASFLEKRLRGHGYSFSDKLGDRD